MLPSREEGSSSKEASSTSGGEIGSSTRRSLSDSGHYFDSPVFKKRADAGGLDKSDRTKTPTTVAESDCLSLGVESLASKTRRQWQDKERIQIIQKQQQEQQLHSSPGGNGRGETAGEHFSSPFRSPNTKTKSLAAKFERQTQPQQQQAGGGLDSSIHTNISLDVNQATGSAAGGGVRNNNNNNNKEPHSYHESFSSTMAVANSPSSSSVVRGSRIFKIDPASLGSSTSLMNSSNFVPPIASSSSDDNTCNDRSWMTNSDGRNRPNKGNRPRIKSNSTGTQRGRIIGNSRHGNDSTRRSSLSPTRAPPTIEEETVDTFSGHGSSQKQEVDDGKNTDGGVSESIDANSRRLRESNSTKISAQSSVVSSEYECGTRVSTSESADDVSIPTFAGESTTFVNERSSHTRSGHTRSSHSRERIRGSTSFPKTELAPIKDGDTIIKDDSKDGSNDGNNIDENGNIETSEPANFRDEEREENLGKHEAEKDDDVEDDHDDEELDAEDEPDHEEQLKNSRVREFVVDRVPSNKKKRWSSRNVHNFPVWPPIIKVTTYEANRMSGVSVGSGFSDDDLTDDFMSSLDGDEFSIEEEFEEERRRRGHPPERRTSYRIRYDGPSTLNNSRFGLPPVPKVDDRFETNGGHVNDGNPGVPGRTADAAPKTPMRRRNSREDIEMSESPIRDDGSIDPGLLEDSDEKRPDVWITPVSGTATFDAMWKVKRVWAIESEDEREHVHSVHNRELFTKIKSLVGAPDTPPGIDADDSHSEKLPAPSRDGTPKMPTRSWHVQTVVERKGRLENLEAEKELNDTEFVDDIELMAVDAVKEIELNKTAEETAKKEWEQRKAAKQKAHSSPTKKAEKWETIDDKPGKSPTPFEDSEETIDGASNHSLRQRPAMQAEEIPESSYHSLKGRPAMQASPKQGSPMPVVKRPSPPTADQTPVHSPARSFRKSISSPPLNSPSTSPKPPVPLEDNNPPRSPPTTKSSKGDLLQSPRKEKSLSKEKKSSKSKRRSSSRSSSHDPPSSRSNSPKSPKRNLSGGRVPRRSKKSDLLKSTDDTLPAESEHSKRSPRKGKLDISTHSTSKSPRRKTKKSKKGKKKKKRSKRNSKSSQSSSLSDGSDGEKVDADESRKSAMSSNMPPLSPRRMIQLSAMAHDSDSDSSTSSSDSSDDDEGYTNSTRRYAKDSSVADAPGASPGENERWWQKSQTKSPSPATLKTPLGGRNKISSRRAAPDARSPPLSTKTGEGAKNKLGKK